ncbi:MAG: flavodoxin domain-containing protein [Thermoanaerobaculia bacterium]
MESIRKLVVIYSSVHGQAEAIARRIGDVATTARADARVVDVHKASANDLADRDSVVIVASVQFGRHGRNVAKFVKTNRLRLSAMHSAFVSVSGSAIDPATQPIAEKQMNDFLRQTGWSPAQRQTFAGAVKFTRYNPFLRFVIKRIHAARGRVLDTRRDYDFTDWEAVDRFAREFFSGSKQQAA